ncbi:RsmF rRNA methyltransferase first C-terminal domain-containing protein [Fructilactobacillus myrtifloralis]|uniref:RsmF rRNA methyltransferase first C-terminal domain-containing protein n=1 Tax=Fructilactobacillus myrtifloralis TaxID=2940301 RepID=A0ABY5BPY3_9LACO|nr:RsmF rRNA methyltransferase first C-terminal domain-containing protein [Fructilactobacillus myrtifloralis]USS85770.1 RsmF rRNA methyltransferase first C-terminal domain-containing protein [Fructilactobacillus myrtifloralis]
MELPTQFKAKYQRLLGDQFPAFLQSFAEAPQHGFRLNPLKPPANPAVDQSRSIPNVHDGYYGKVDGKSPAHQSGYVYSQEPSAMLVAEAVAPKPGERVLDLCAAPGGKSTQLAGLMQNQGLLVANEIDRGRAKVLVENLERFGVWNPLILNERPDRLSPAFPAYFDKILVDAPCSGEGMFRKNPTATTYWDTDYPAACAVRQREILQEAVKMLKPGGQLVYSTCTFAPEEDEQIIAWLLDQYPLELVALDKSAGMSDGRPEWANGNPDLQRALRLFPQSFAGDGHFIAKLQSTATGKPVKIRGQRSNVAGAERKEWQQFVAQNLTDFKAGSLLQFGEQLYSFNPEIPDLQGLRVMRPGTPLGTLKKHRIEPSYGLAMVLRPEQAQRTLTISYDQWQQYVHGDTFSTDAELPKGWYLLLYQQMPVGFGKVVNGTVKNFFPKGLRFQV